jgi:hypothetical protein
MIATKETKLGVTAMTKREMVKEYEAAGYDKDAYIIARRLVKSNMRKIDVVKKLQDCKYLSAIIACGIVEMACLHLCCEA